MRFLFGLLGCWRRVNSYTPPTPSSDVLLMEIGDRILLETGDGILLE